MKLSVLVVVLVTSFCMLAADSFAVNSSSQLISTGPAGGNGPFYSDFSGVPNTATRALFWTKESLTGTDADSSIDLYERSGSSTTLVSTGPAGGNGAFAMNYGKTNAAGNKVFFATNEKLTTDDTDTFMDVYERSGGSTTLVSKGSIGTNGPHDAFFAGASADGSRVWFETAERLSGSDTDTFRDVYERFAGNTTVISIGPGGGNGDDMSEWAGASADGSKVWIHTDESLVAADTDLIQDVYERSSGTMTLVSTGPISSADPDTRAAFRFASSDGSRVIFNTREQLTTQDTDNGGDVYERVNGTSTNLLSIGNQSPVPGTVASFAAASQDGTKVYFESTEKLDAADLDAYVDVYLRSGGTTTLVTGGGGNQVASNALTTGVSDDGSKLFFRSEEPLSASDTDPADDIYQWQSGTRTLLSGGSQDADAHPAMFSADGNDAFFYTYEPLVGADTDNAVDIYQRTGGSIYLISTGTAGGTGPYDVTYSGATLDGKRIFFRTREQLTAQDTDSSDDIYSADVGGQINIVLDNSPEDPQNFTYTIGGGLSLGLGGGSTFELDDDSDPALSNTRSFTGVSPGTGYSVSQDIPEGWDQTGASCDNGSSPAAINVAPAQTVTCTFTNRKRGRIVVVEDSIPDDPQDFSFTAGGGLSPASFTLDDDADPTNPNTVSFDDLVPGAGYTVSQSPSPGWALTGLTCSDGSPGSNIDVAPGETVTCTFTNRKRGSLVIVKDTQPNDAQDFTFTASGLTPSTFMLDDDSDGTLSNSRTFTNLSAGATFSVTETVPPGWGQQSAICDNGDPVTAIHVPFNTTVTCTFTNTTTGQIVVVKDATPNDPQDFSFTAGGGLSPASFSLDDDADGTLSNTVTFNSVPSGSGYSVAETVPSGWDQTSATCSDGSPISNIDVSAGETVTCTFSNRKRGRIIVVKDATPDDPQDFSFTAGGGLSPASFSLDDDANGTLSNTRTFDDVVPGSGYTLSETVPSGWDQTSATCSDGSPISNIDVSADETVTCTFANRKRGQIIAVKDAVPNDAQDFAFTAGGGLSPASFSLDDDSDGTLPNSQTFSNVVPGSGYSLSETLPGGWVQTSATCSDGSPVGNINLAAGEVVTCTWVNTKAATLTVTKNAVPDDPQDFSFTAGGGLSPSSFSLDDDADGVLSNTRTFSNVAPGSGYSVSESVPSGWDQNSAICSDGSPVTNVNLSAGENVTCTFTNTKRGSLVIVEDSQPDDVQDFSYTAGGGLSPSVFSLDDDTNGTLSNTRTFANVTPGSYSVTQGANPSGWNLSSATCSNGNSPSSITVAAGQTVTCTFTNKRQGSIVVIQDTQPDDPQDFSFTAGGGLSPSSFQLDDHSNPTLPNTQTFSNVPAQAGYSITQAGVSGWILASSTCSNGNSAAAITVAPAQTVTCTFVDQRPATLTIVKDTVPDDAQNFDFTAGAPLSPTSFQLDDDTNGALSNTRQFANVVPGTYNVAEANIPAGWDLASATCSDGSPVTAIVLSGNETTTCTFTNNLRGNLTVVKDAQPNAAQDFPFLAGGGLSPASFTLDDDSDPVLSNTQTYSDIPTGSAATYSLSESVPAGWAQTAATCSDGDSPTAINITPGTTVTCTFTNLLRGQINIVKDATPDDPQDFSFTAGGGLSPASFSLDDDPGNATLPNTTSFTNLVPQAGYSVAETVPSGWDQTSATCSDGSPVSNINVGSGETVTCTFANRKRGRIIVVKDATPDDAQDFSFTAGGGLSPASFSLDDDANGTLSNTQTFNNVVPGAGYSLAETVPTGWDQTSATCSDGSPITNIDVSVDETVTCTFSNRKRGQIVAVKDAIPNDAQDFSFTAGGGLSPASFSLDDDANGTLSNTQTFSNVVPGAGYSLAETVPTGWDQTSATCSDGSPPSNVDVSPGETVTCTWVNSKRASLTVTKDAVPDDPQDFSFTAGGGLSPGSFSLDDDTNGTLSNTQTFSNLPPGSGYSVSEQTQPGWDLGSATCSDGSPVSNINLTVGENVTCTFTNNKRATIVVVKDAQPDDAQDFSFTTGGGLSPGTFDLDDDSNPTLSNTQTFTDLTAGSGYSVSEAVPAGWDQSSATCSDGSPVSNISLTGGETVTCTFTNRKRGQIAVVKDSTPDDAQDFSFTAGGGLSPASFSLDDDANPTLSNTQTFSSVVPGAGYSITETVPTGWDQTSATCSDGSPVSNIDVAAGEAITCTFANRKRARLIVIQDSTPNDAQDFAFTASTTAGSVNFSLDDDSDPTLSNTRTFNNIAPGSAVSVSQTVPSGWDQTSATCDDGSPISAVDVQAGEVVTCTFNDRKRGQIVAVKDTVPDDPQDFSFTAGGGLSPGSFSLDDDANGTLSNTQTFANVVPGSGYTLAETVPSGWDQTSATCSDGSPVSNIDVAAGEIVTCTWVNAKRATLTVTKDAAPNDPQDFAFNVAVPGDGSLNFSLDDDSEPTLDSSRTFNNVAPGAGYTISETVPSGWDQTSATCDDGSPPSNVTLSPGESVECTFTNQKRGRIVVVKDATPDDPQDFTFTTGGGLSPASFQLDDDANPTLSNTQTISNVAVGAGYSVAETVPTGWDLTSATCDDGSPVSNINVGPDETVTCTFNNRKRGQIVVVKDAQPNDPQDFSFSAGGGLSPASFSLDDDANGTLSNTQTFSNVVPGSTYSVSETVPGGWDQTSATCSDGSPVSSIDVGAGETVTCTFTNAKRGQIVIVKDATPDDAQDFAFTAGGGLSPASFSLDDDANPTLSNTQTFSSVVPGAGYSITETVPSGWDQTSATCSDGSPVSNIDVAAGEVVTCTFSNRKRGQIVAVKNAVPDDPQDFSFAAGGGLSPASFQLDDDANPTLSNTQTFANVVPGSGYSLAETVPSGWDQTSATCSDGSPVSNVDVAAGETVTCTWVNTKRATLTVAKDAVPNDPQDFAFTTGGGLTPASFSLDDDSDGTLTNSQLLANIMPGSGYSVSETVPSGWDQASATCSDGSPVSNISFSPGENVTCTFTNQKRGRIVVVKDATPDDPQDFTFTTGGGLSPASFQLDDDANPTLSNTQTISNVAVGAGYSVAETVPTGWDLTSATCDDGSPVSNINVGPDETVTCTFNNRKRGQIVVVKDAQPNDPQDFSFSAGGGLSPASFSLDDDANGTLSNTQTFANVVPGSTYSVSETVPGGWDQTSATCSDGSPVSSIDVAAGETVTCTFTNAKRGQIVVVKDATPDDAQDFAFTAGGGLSPASFSLDDDANLTLSNTRTFATVLPGSGYSLSETVPSGWDQTSATCDDGSPVSNISVSVGETVTCTFANRKRGQINVVKNATPDDPQDFSFTTTGGLPVSSFDLDDDGDGTLSNTETIPNVVPAAGYGIQETVPSGWDQTSATCSDGSPVSNVDVAPGETVTCTFNNRKRAVLTVVKDAVPNDPQDFDFTVAVPGDGSLNFSLDDDSDGTLSSSRTFNNVVPNSGYTITEAPEPGWDLSASGCDDGSAPSNVALSAGEHVTCTFVNHKRGRIVIVKDATPDDPQDFTFTTGGGLSPASFQLDDDANPTLSNTQTLTNVAVGAGYSVSETVPTGWDLTSATCDDGSPVSNINVGPDETVTCTFNNRKRGQIVAVKDATPNDAQDFAFTAGGGLSPASFSLDDDANGTLSNTQTFTNVVPGSSYSLAETVPSGWDQTSATCSDGSSPASIDVAAGEVITCTFANRKRATLTVVKDAQPNDPQDFDFTASVPGDGSLDFSLDDDSDGTLSNTRTFPNLVPANGYSVSETVPPGWDQSSAVCDDGSAPASIDLAAGESVTCTFTNTKRGNIVIVKDAQPNDAQDFSFTAGGGLSPASFQLDDDADPTLSNTRTFANVLPGSGYSVSESVPAGWSLGSATCSDGSPVSNISVSADETVTCTWTNLRHGQVHVVTDSQPNDPQDFAFTAGGGLSPTSFSLDDDSNPTLSNTQDFNDVAPGTGYTISESPPAGWDLSSATCDDGSPTFNITVAPGEVVTCTFTNTKRGNIVIVKDAQPNDPQDFGFTAGGGLSPASFSLDDDSDGTLSNTRTFTNVAAGTYSVAEQATAGWVQESATCDDGSAPGSIGVSAGETVTCTFTNDRKGQIVVVKDAQPNDAQDFSFTAGGGLSPASFQLDDDADGTLSNTRTFSNLNPGSGYSLAETVPSGWDQTAAACDDGSPLTNISISAGETVTCTFTNRKRGQIVVVKDAQPSDAQDFGFTAGGGLTPASFSLDDDADATLSNSRTFANLVPGSGYSLAETLPLPSGWVQASATCSDGSSPANISVAAGESVTCTFTNVRGYARPKAATPNNFSLVIAYDNCTGPNRVHASPLSFSSCSPPSESSDYLTAGTPDANAKTANFVGSVLMMANNGNPSTPADEADVSIAAHVSDVRMRSNINTDYTGQLGIRIPLQITDRANGPSGTEIGTTQLASLMVPMPCVQTSGSTEGGVCDVATSIESVIPGAVSETKRTIWELGQIEVLDGGADGSLATNDNTVFARQGVFVP